MSVNGASQHKQDIQDLHLGVYETATEDCENPNVERHLWIKSKASTCLNAFGRRIYWSSCRALKVVRQDSENHRGKLTILAIIKAELLPAFHSVAEPWDLTAHITCL